MPPQEQERITVILDEDPEILSSDIVQLTDINKATIASIVGKATEAMQIRKERENAKAAKRSAEERQMESILLAMLEAPNGVTKADILVAAETDTFIAATNKFRAYLRRKNAYTLKKRTVDKKPLYVLDPIR